MEVREDLVNYIETQRKAGKTDVEIMAIFVAHGHSQEDIAPVFRHIDAQNQPPGMALNAVAEEKAKTKSDTKSEPKTEEKTEDKAATDLPAVAGGPAAALEVPEKEDKTEKTEKAAEPSTEAAAPAKRKRRRSRTAKGLYWLTIAAVVVIPAAIAAAGYFYFQTFQNKAEQQVQNAAGQNAKRQLDLFNIQFALDQFHGKNSRYPDRLTELAPDFLDALPTDPVTDYAYEYQLTETGDYKLCATMQDGMSSCVNSQTNPLTNDDEAETAL